MSCTLTWLSPYFHVAAIIAGNLKDFHQTCSESSNLPLSTLVVNQFCALLVHYAQQAQFSYSNACLEIY